MSAPRVIHLASALCSFISLGLMSAACSAPSDLASSAEPESAPESAPESSPEPQRAAREALVRYEEARRAEVDWSSLAGSQTGPDPTTIYALREGGAVGLLRGASALVWLDEALEPRQRPLEAPRSPVGLAVMPDGAVVVSGEEDRRLMRFVVRDEELVSAGSLSMAPEALIRDLASGPEGVLYAVDERSGLVEALALDAERFTVERRVPFGRCAGPVQVLRAGRRVLVNCLLAREIRIWSVDARGMPDGQPPETIKHDGPFWSMSAYAQGRELWVAAGGVEDRPLERRDGAFGFIDSFVYVWRVGAQVRPVASVNVSAHGVITPKALSLSAAGEGEDAVEVLVTGYGGGAGVRLSVSEAAPVTVAPFEAPPGVAGVARRTDGAGWWAANPLLDTWMMLEVGPRGQVRVRSSAAQPAGPRAVDERVGELLFFTQLMAPWNGTEGERSRFTCETCHFEGYVDGRTHFTGRGEVFATTKPLVGLFSNRPHFTRALDKTMTQMVFNEFKVANRKSGHDPWFEVTVDEVPWLSQLDGVPEALDPVTLRRSLMAFLMAFNHRPNPATRGRMAYTAEERRGAEVFEARCARCHGARLVADDPDSEQPFDRWEAEIFGAGALVWASDSYQKTGVEPYVHKKGARPVSLRRLYKKHPYLTGGQASSLDELLAMVAWEADGERFFHDQAPASAQRLSESERAALRAFLDLL